MIYHVAKQTEWEAAQPVGEYAPAAYPHEGFIHACSAGQVEGVLERHFKNVSGLLLLHIDEKKLTAPHNFVFVPAVNDEFPHIHGTINNSAVTAVTIIED